MKILFDILKQILDELEDRQLEAISEQLVALAVNKPYEQKKAKNKTRD